MVHGSLTANDINKFISLAPDQIGEAYEQPAADFLDLLPRGGCKGVQVSCLRYTSCRLAAHVHQLALCTCLRCFIYACFLVYFLPMLLCLPCCPSLGAHSKVLAGIPSSVHPMPSRQLLHDQDEHQASSTHLFLYRSIIRDIIGMAEGVEVSYNQPSQPIGNTQVQALTRPRQHVSPCTSFSLIQERCWQLCAAGCVVSAASL